LVLLGLLAILALWALEPSPQRNLSADLPALLSRHEAVVAPSGQLANAFKLARPATLRLVVRSSHPYGGASESVGTAFFISPDGLALTAYHVVKEGDIYRAKGPEGAHYRLKLVGFDAYDDLALLKAEVKTEVPYLHVAASPPKVGDEVVAIGNSRGDLLQARAGKIIRLHTPAVRADFASGTIEMTNALAPGDSGGPVVNAQVQVVGVVSYISFAPEDKLTQLTRLIPPFLRQFLPERQFASYAVPVTQSSTVLAGLERGEKQDVPVIGFYVGPNYSPGSPHYGDLGPYPGVIVGKVASGSPADEAGLRSYRESYLRDDQGNIVGIDAQADVIYALDGERTPDYAALIRVIREKKIGQRVTVSVERGKQKLKLTLTLAAEQSVNF
jgi:S1-C subfamily serine protease